MPRLIFGPRGGVTIGFQCLFRCSHAMTHILSKPSRSLRAILWDLVCENFDLSDDGCVIVRCISQFRLSWGTMPLCIWRVHHPNRLHGYVGGERNRIDVIFLGGNAGIGLSGVIARMQISQIVKMFRIER